jgi:hypothetical protein
MPENIPDEDVVVQECVYTLGALWLSLKHPDGRRMERTIKLDNWFDDVDEVELPAKFLEVMENDSHTTVVVDRFIIDALCTKRAYATDFEGMPELIDALKGVGVIFIY